MGVAGLKCGGGPNNAADAGGKLVAPVRCHGHSRVGGFIGGGPRGWQGHRNDRVFPIPARRLQPVMGDWRSRARARKQDAAPVASAATEPGSAHEAAWSEPGPAPAPAEATELPAGWQAVEDPATGAIYYANLETRVRGAWGTEGLPAASAVPCTSAGGASPPAPASAGGGGVARNPEPGCPPCGRSCCQFSSAERMHTSKLSWGWNGSPCMGGMPATAKPFTAGAQARSTPRRSTSLGTSQQLNLIVLVGMLMFSSSPLHRCSSQETRWDPPEA